MSRSQQLRCAGRTVLTTLLALALLAGCAGQQPLVRAGDPQAGLPALSAPAELARSAAFTAGGLVHEGSDYNPMLPRRNVSPSGTDANFTPTGTTAAGLAYTVYSFGVQNFDRDLNLRFTWGQAPQAGKLWVGLANFTTNRWDWLSPTDVRVAGFSNLADYTGPAAKQYPLYCVVCLTNGSFGVLGRVRLGTPDGQPVVTQLATADFNRGGTQAPNDWMSITGTANNTLYHNFSFFQNQAYFASDLCELLDQGEPVARYDRDEGSHLADGALPLPRAYRYNTDLGTAATPGSLVRLDGFEFGAALGSLTLAVGTPSETVVSPGNILDWQDKLIIFNMPGNLNSDLTGRIMVETAEGATFTSSEDLYCSAYITGVAPSQNVDRDGVVAITGFDFLPPPKTDEIGDKLYLFWVINATYTNPFTAVPETGLALVAHPMEPDVVTPNLLTFDMSRLDSVEVEVYNLSQSASAIVPATQAGNAIYYAFLWTGAIEPFSRPAEIVAQSGLLSQAVRIEVGASADPLAAHLWAQPNTTSALGGPPVQFDFSASNGAVPYVDFTIDFGDGSPLFSSSSAGSTSHVYAVPSGPGGYSATLTVTDSAAETSVDGVTVVVTP
jgi:hypothetical protein